MDLQKMIQETFPLYEDMDDMEVAQTIWRRRGAEILGERLKQQFIEWAADWLGKHTTEYASFDDDMKSDYENKTNFIESFKKYAEEQL